MKKISKKNKTFLMVLGAGAIGGGIVVSTVAQACNSATIEEIDREQVIYERFSDTHSATSFSSTETNRSIFSLFVTSVQEIASSQNSATAIQWSRITSTIGFFPTERIQTTNFAPASFYGTTSRSSIINNATNSLSIIGGLFGLIYLHNELQNNAASWISANLFTDGNEVTAFRTQITNIFTFIAVQNIAGNSFLSTTFFTAVNVPNINLADFQALNVTVSNNIATSELLTSITDLFSELASGNLNAEAASFLNYINNIAPATTDSSLNLSIDFNSQVLNVRVGNQIFISLQSNNYSIISALGRPADYLLQGAGEATTVQGLPFRSSSVVFYNPFPINNDGETVVIT